jgi:hypothetical protein
VNTRTLYEASFVDEIQDWKGLVQVPLMAIVGLYMLLFMSSPIICVFLDVKSLSENLESNVSSTCTLDHTRLL